MIDPELRAEAVRIVTAMHRPATVAQVGGFRPSTDPATSRWGGGFLSRADEPWPICALSGRPLRAILQIRCDELPVRPAALDGVALLTFWFDTFGDDWWDQPNGRGFLVRTYDTLDGLVMTPPPDDFESELGLFPVRWQPATMDRPSWEDRAIPLREIPLPVVRDLDDDWFNEMPHAYETKVGGWPSWTQGGKDGDGFVFQVCSNDKGRLLLGDNGSVYLFKSGADWHMFGDCY